MNIGLKRCLPGMTSIGFQDVLYAVRTNKLPASLTYEDFQTLELNKRLLANQYMNRKIRLVFIFACQFK